MSLAETIRTIRRRRGETMVEFARNLGCGHSTISQYESGKIRPRATALRLLFHLAETDEERQPILDALGVSKKEAQEAFTRQTAEFAEMLQKQKAFLALEPLEDPHRERFRFLAHQIEIGEPPPPPALVQLLQLWRDHGGHHGMKSVLQRAAAFVEVEAKALARQPAQQPRREPPSDYEDYPFMVYAKCPQKSRWYPANIKLEKRKDLKRISEVFDISGGYFDVNCPHCGGTHRLRPNDKFQVRPAQ